VTTGLFQHRQHNAGSTLYWAQKLRRAPRPAPRANGWTEARTNELCDWIADGFTFAEAARAMGITRHAAMSEFRRVREALGWQAQ
jgi:hypothetical protein